ncbi:hypothetical protein ACWT_0994 [Actinoplanes sp. SE50]|uniref:LytR C-terminal domain-containing protein n=1 Tax=unclassified Actinoplanes TaxID=2626549 RepID=UPI00023EC8DF|nr:MULTISPECIES: LytR C-terminal domain-containing protein [unclassified Actinoplanes]AEV82010.1 hypothetical protein ACPL_1113 [Actinoplanes sp. SE50/110]ATO80409.1 hypothetical protein ACWT_0994 [Actinoplanes sp. SE50]SLL97816.1 hypothetical protein ACSP50_1026 [Actinoplanes sp. SE50/110]
MSRPVPDRLRELAAEVGDLPVPPAAEVRARGRQRSRRRLAVVTAAGLALVATAGVTVIWPRRPAPVDDLVAGGPPPSAAALHCSLALPDDPVEVRIRVLDGGASTALIDATAAHLRERRFTVLNGATGSPLEGAASVSYGPAGIGSAALVRAYLQDGATMLFDPGIRDDIIAVTLGPAFTRLATPTEANRNLVAVGEPTAPPQCATVGAPAKR